MVGLVTRRTLNEACKGKMTLGIRDTMLSVTLE